MSPENRATVQSEHLSAAFHQGVAEGLAGRDSEEEFVVGLLFEGTKINEGSFPIIEAPLIRFVVEHLESAVGASVIIERRLKVVKAVSGPTEADDDEVVDAEIVD